MGGERIVVAGEAVIDLVAESDGRYRPFPGGSPANVAIGLARLGVPTALLARISTSAFGGLIRSHLGRNGVSLDFVRSAPEPATLAVVSLDDDGRAGYDFYADGTVDWRWSDSELPATLPATTDAFVTGSIAALRPPGAGAIRRLIERIRAGVTIVVDPNIRPALLGAREDAMKRWEALLGLADVVKLSDEDLAWLAPGRPSEEVAVEWARRGPALVVVTRGDRGSFAVTTRGSHVAVPAASSNVIDTVGAGDAFTSGLVNALGRLDALGRSRRERLAALPDDELRRTMGHASAIASITCSRPGADPPTAAELAASNHQSASLFY